MTTLEPDPDEKKRDEVAMTGYVLRQCRDCGTDFQIPERLAVARSKWASLCSSCLVWEC